MYVHVYGKLICCVFIKFTKSFVMIFVVKWKSTIIHFTHARIRKKLTLTLFKLTWEWLPV